MKMSKIVLGMSLALGVASFGHAADQGHGTITFEGSIIDAPCSIQQDTINQTVDLGQVSKAALANKGTSIPQNFEIKLDNCNLEEDKNSVSAKFTGTAGATEGMLGMIGTAKGASIAVTDGSGKLLKLGTATAAQALQDGSNALQFSAYLQGDGVSGSVVPGDFTSVANFTLSYQ